MEWQLAVEMTDDLIRKTGKETWFRQFWRVTAWLGFLFIIGLQHGLAGKDPYWLGSLLLWAMAALAGLSLFVEYRRQLKTWISLFGKMDSRNVAFVVADDGIRVSSAAGTLNLQWNMFSRILRKQRMWLLFSEFTRFPFCLPTDAMDTALKDHISWKMTKNGVPD